MGKMAVQIRLTGVVALVGNYGSGKTEVAVHLALHQRQQGQKVQVADLDLVNPYFRTREVRRLLQAHQVDIVLPPEHLLQADLPVLTPEVAGLISNPAGLAILDVGGDGVGAKVLAALGDAFQSAAHPVHVLQVVNPFRPNTDTVAQCQAMRTAIEAGARLAVNGWVGNAHLMEETTARQVYQGADFMRELQEASGLAVQWICVPQALAAEVDLSRYNWPILAIGRQLVPPWRPADSI
jgi:energy-coupling factor transporter ATP-binding protein EcfA2